MGFSCVYACNCVYVLLMLLFSHLFSSCVFLFPFLFFKKGKKNRWSWKGREVRKIWENTRERKLHHSILYEKLFSIKIIIREMPIET